MINWLKKTVSINEIKSNEKNPRYITKDDMEELRDRIERLGFHAVLVCDTNGVILAGNQRYEALKALKYNTVDILYPDRELTEKERQEVIVTDNTHQGEFDYDVLANEFNIDDLIDWGVYVGDADEGMSLNDEIEHLIDTFTLSLEFPKNREQEIKKRVRDYNKEELSKKILEILGL